VPPKQDQLYDVRFFASFGTLKPLTDFEKFVILFPSSRQCSYMVDSKGVVKSGGGGT